ncbi:hypothetical protein G3I01_02985 [Gramella sp. MT6]|uniref:hypothetical protein n=1 Tax=Gramella sp. MT6 TaxID=2705471 RepID=UPI001C5D869C|nr:hypothetical protein [Gramella sp. MT6]QYA24514.1 hypothetical protein G3I01_02985 [Gramella sp. MT6]
MLFTVIGTLSHEYGHILAARSLGYDATLHYGSMSYDNSALTDRLDTIYLKNRYAIENDLTFDKREEFDRGMKELYADDFKVLIGGPLQTIITGCIGLVILLLRRKRIHRLGMKLLDWVAVFLSLFWLREVFNLLHSVTFGIIFQEDYYFGGDEMYISEYYKWHPGTLPILSGIIGTGISVYVIFRIIPVKYRRVFILSGIIGGLTGFYVWFEILGPVLIPYN